jgi:hypothetical protein
MMSENPLPNVKTDPREDSKLAALDDFVQSLEDQPDPLARVLGHLTGQTVSLASQLGGALNQDMSERQDKIEAFREHQRLIGTFLQLQRQAERNQQLVARLTNAGQELAPAARSPR